MAIPILGQHKDDPFKDRDLTVRKLDDSGPVIRLLFCFNCTSIEELPNFEGRPENDTLLTITLEKHHSAGVPHTGHLFTVPLRLWTSEASRNEIIKQIKVGSGGISELDPDFYETKSQFGEDAMACFAAHQRPKGQCPDYKSDKKVLQPKTNEARKELGMPLLKDVGGPKMFLCDFCPVKSFNMQKAREAAGAYT